MDFQLFDNIPDPIAITDEYGEINYCNVAFATLAQSSLPRLINKKIRVQDTISGVWPEGELSQVSTIGNYKTKLGTTGVAQIIISSFIEEGKSLFFVYLRDYSLEEKLQKKYKFEEDLKLKKIEELKTLIELLKSTRLVKEPFILAREFIQHITSHFNMPYAIYKEKGGAFQWIRKLSDPTNEDILSAWQYLSDLDLTYTFQKSEDWIYVPIKARDTLYMEILFPIVKINFDLDLDIVRTLSEHTSMIVDNVNLEEMATHDELTKLKNSRIFREIFQEYCEKNEQLYLAMLDIDHFKKVNDTYGHQAGDLVLKEIAKVLRKLETAENICARVGGEEFALLLPRITTAEALAQLEKVRKTIEGLKIEYMGKVIPITSSFGLAKWIPKKMNVYEFYKNADTALYASKTGGRNRVTLWNEKLNKKEESKK